MAIRWSHHHHFSELKEQKKETDIKKKQVKKWERQEKYDSKV